MPSTMHWSYSYPSVCHINVHLIIADMALSARLCTTRIAVGVTAQHRAEDFLYLRLAVL